MSDLTHPAAVMARLETIDRELAEYQNTYEQAAGDKARLTRDWERRYLIARKKATGNDADARKAAAFVAAYEADEGLLFGELSDAEARFEAQKVAVKLRETRVSIGQSILKAQGRA